MAETPGVHWSERLDTVSVLLVKPEVFGLADDQVETVFTAVKEVTKGKVLEKRRLSINPDQAQELWEEAVGSYPWADKYYDHMASAPLFVYILDGKETAIQDRDEIRSRLNGIVPMERSEAGHRNDIVHGCDDGLGKRELEILGLTN